MVRVDTRKINKEYFKSEKYFLDAEKTRGALLFMGPLLARFGAAYIPKTGGDKIGARPIDTHTLGFIKLGAVLSADDSCLNYLTLDKVVSDKEILLEDASVTGTANILMCASKGTENLIIYNAASETYISQLCKVLKSSGMNITGEGTNKINISGALSFDKDGNFEEENINTVEHTILPDFIEVASFMSLAMGTKSEITIKNAGIKNLGMTLNMFEKLGCKFEIMGDNIKVLKQEKYEIQKMYDGSMMKIYSSPWPMISPDILSVGIVAAMQCEGVALFHEKMYEARMFFVDKLIAMGAQIVLCDPHRVVVTGNNWKSKLNARHMTSPDIRAGISLLIAALGAEGESVINNVEQIDRGYENIEVRLAALGAKIQRID
jgi:UDP-N-acetylglucosamine 1-carboxyvinyltransferase